MFLSDTYPGGLIQGQGETVTLLTQYIGVGWEGVSRDPGHGVTGEGGGRGRVREGGGRDDDTWVSPRLLHHERGRMRIFHD